MAPETRFPDSTDGSGAAAGGEHSTTAGEPRTPSGAVGHVPEAAHSAGPPKRARYLRRALVGLLLLILLIAGMIGWRAWQSRGSENAVGIYIAGGGLGYLVIERSLLGGLRVQNESLELSMAPDTLKRIWPPSPLGKTSTRLCVRGDNLFLSRTGRTRNKVGVGDAYRLEMTLARSVSIAGDWDLVSFHLEKYTEERPGKIFSLAFWKDRLQARSIKEFFDGFISKKLEGSDSKWDFGSDHSPLRSFLHRLDDPRLADYFEARLKEPSWPAHLETIRALCSSHPDDPYLVLHQIELETTQGNLEKAEFLWDKWKAGNPAPEELLEITSRRVWKTLAAVQFRKRHPSLPCYEEVFDERRTPKEGKPTLASSEGGPYSLKERLAWQKQFGETGELMFLERRLIPPVRASRGYGNLGERLDFGELHLHKEALCSLDIFYLLQGRRKENLELLEGLYRLGQSVNADGGCLQRHTGVSIKRWALSGLWFHLFNACETVEEIHRFEKALERLARTQGKETGRQIALEAGVPPLLRYTANAETDLYPFEDIVPQDAAKVEFTLLRLAAVAKRHFLETGRFPNTEEEFGALLPEGRLPTDPYLTTCSLRLKNDQEGLIIYSVGPNRQDDDASAAYSLPDGNVNYVDIRIVVFRERKYPFPATPVHARNATELLEQFPNGLPMDAFGEMRPKFSKRPDKHGYPSRPPLSILDSTATQPLQIISAGPDGSLFGSPRKGLKGPGLRILNAGPGVELFDRFSDSSGSVKNALPSDKFPAAFENWQLVFQHDDLTSFPTFPHPYYDPTNGALSEGNLFIEIPPPEPAP